MLKDDPTPVGLIYDIAFGSPHDCEIGGAVVGSIPRRVEEVVVLADQDAVVVGYQRGKFEPDRAVGHGEDVIDEDRQQQVAAVGETSAGFEVTRPFDDALRPLDARRQDFLEALLTAFAYLDRTSYIEYFRTSQAVVGRIVLEAHDQLSGHGEGRGQSFARVGPEALGAVKAMHVHERSAEH